MTGHNAYECLAFGICAPAGRAKESGEMRILAVDDDPVILDILEQYLPSEDGYILDLNASAENGIDSLNGGQTAFDCIILDIMLPGMNGIEMCALLRKTKLHCAVPILMITGSKELSLMTQAFSAGATDFITKPLDKHELTARVNSASMLNESLARAQHTMSEMSRLMKIKFSDPLKLEIEGMSEFLELENELLRSRSGCFAMTLFSLDIDGLRGIYRSVRASSYRQCLDTIAETAVWATQKAQAKLTYTGNGRFIGAVLDRRRISCDDLTQSFNAKLAEVWDTKATEVPSPPTGRFAQISNQRMWSGMSASDTLRDSLSIGDGFSGLSSSAEYNLFSRLDEKLSQSK